MTGGYSPFVPIASRRLVLATPDGQESPIYLAVGAPYRPSIMLPSEHQAGCLVLTCDDPDLATEVPGFDEIDALSSALGFLQIYLIKLVEQTGGQLKSDDGIAVDPTGSLFYQQIQQIIRRKGIEP